MVCFVPLLFLPVYLCANVRSQGLLVVTLPAPFIPQSTSLWVPPRCHKTCAPRLPVSAPPSGLDECFFFISLVVRLQCGSIFCQFWLFLFLNCCCPFGCARRRSVSTYASLLVSLSLPIFIIMDCLPSWCQLYKFFMYFDKGN